MPHCPCCSGQPFASCCGPLLDGQPATSPEAVMRSRYTAFCLNKVEYLYQTLAHEYRAGFDPAEVGAWNAQTRWTGLEVLDASIQGTQGEVYFRASFVRQGRAQTLVERSRFIVRDGRWYYLDGVHESEPIHDVSTKIGRNTLCPCGSGKKFKKCCGVRS